jgi:hypothetical protein
VNEAESQNTRMKVIVTVVIQGVRARCKAKQGKGVAAAGVQGITSVQARASGLDAYKKAAAARLVRRRRRVKASAVKPLGEMSIFLQGQIGESAKAKAPRIMKRCLM